MVSVVILFIICYVSSVISELDLSRYPPEYGVDCSYPIHYGINHEECPYWYNQYHILMQGCYKAYSQAECDANEADRMRMNLAQPKTQHNYTEIGFQLRKTPQLAWNIITKFYNENKRDAKPEKWYRGNTIVNTWESPSQMISFENPAFRGGFAVKQQIWDLVRPVIEEWVGRKVEPTSMYGIRIYSGGSILSTRRPLYHLMYVYLTIVSTLLSVDVDRLPLVSSCIINVDQDVDEPWPLEVYDHNGKAYNVTMEPGDLVLYESSTVLHGRPFPMRGRSYVSTVSCRLCYCYVFYQANIFVHYKPIDHEEMNEGDEEQRREPLAIPRRHGPLTRSLRLPSLIDGQPVPEPKGKIFMHAAAQGDSDTLHAMLKTDPDLIHYADENNWQALHEAVRSGRTEEVKYLVEQGADIGWKVKGGGSALWLARKSLPREHHVIKYFLGIGSPEY
jgi:prolyl 4-hydroxylase